MRIIRTSIRHRRIKAAAIAAAAAAVPAAVFLSLKAAPFISGSMMQLLSFQSMTDIFRQGADVNNGSLLLFEPEEILTEDISAAAEAEQIPSEFLIKTENLSSEYEDMSVFSQHSGDISEETFGKANGDMFINLKNGGQIRNCTELSPEFVAAECSKPSNISIELYSDKPQVLIVHTHTSESYEPYEKDWYDSSYTCRSYDAANSVVSVGNAIAEELAANGINVIHDCTLHDEVYTGAYLRSLATTENALSRYPSVKVVLDIHRDAIEYQDGTRVSAVTEIEGRKAAQVMIISAADDGNYDIPDYLENLHFASELQQSMESRYSGLTRPVLFQYCQYNQQISTGALLIEVGSHGNSIEQAVYSGQLIGSALSELLAEKAGDIAVPCGMPLYFIDRVR